MTPETLFLIMPWPLDQRRAVASHPRVVKIS